MHDPMTVAFDLPRPWPRLAREGIERRLYGRFYWPTWVTIWHVDPERDGTDDSCGWFLRARHGDKAVLARIRQSFNSEWGEKPEMIHYHYWFSPEGAPNMDTSSIVLDMFLRAAQQVYSGRRFDKHGWRGARRFCRRHLFEIQRFAGNSTDSMHTIIQQSYGRSERRDERIARAAAIVYGCILDWSRPWYRHPRWHVWHWRVQVHPVQAFKRWAFSRCSLCGGRFMWGESPVSTSWSGGGPRWFRREPHVYHSRCSQQAVKSR